MSETSFELTVSVSNDTRLAGTVRALVICAANQAGCAETAAVAFGRRVEDTVRNSLSGAGHDGMLPVTVRHHASTVEVVVNGHTLRLDI
jgi:hypothetical protein